MKYIFLCIIIGVASVYGKQCNKLCSDDSECGVDYACVHDHTGCDFWCQSTKNDLPPNVIGKRSVTSLCPQQCLLIINGRHMCDCAGTRENGSGNKK